MVESAIIAMVMVIVFACMWAAVSYEHAKIRIMDEARAQAWQGALAGGGKCAGGEDLKSEVGSAAPQAAGGSLPDTSSIDKDVIPVSGNGAFTDSGYLTVELERKVTFPGVIGGSTYSMMGKFHMRCNEEKKDDDGRKYFLLALGIGAIAALAAALL